MRSPVRALVLLALAACPGSDELPVSGSADPSIQFNVPPPEVLEGWPCPPFDVETSVDKVDDDDQDTMSDCQEEYLGSNPQSNDSDGDGVLDQFEVGDPGDAKDTDGDGIIDLLDTDDDDDGVPTKDEDLVSNGGNGNGDPRDDDWDIDGVANFADADDDDDGVSGRNRVAPLEGCPVCLHVPPVGTLWEDTDEDGDPTNDDLDGDGIPNRLDFDDDGDGALTIDEDLDRIPTRFDDIDFDCIPNWQDLDDDGDGFLTADEDWDNSGSIMDDDYDNDGVEDFQDVDEDGDNVRNLDDGIQIDTDGDGQPNYRDADDDNDGVITALEDVERYFIIEEMTTPTGTPTDPTTDCPALPAPPTPIPDAIGFVIDDDTDEDGIPNFLDADDDGDGCLTIDEDVNGNGAAFDDLGPNMVGEPPKPIPYFLDPSLVPCAN